MDVLSAHSYDTLVELEREDYHERKLKKWWGTSRGPLWRH